MQPQTLVHDLRRSVKIPHSNHRPRIRSACVRGTLSIPPLNTQWCWGAARSMGAPMQLVPPSPPSASPPPPPLPPPPSPPLPRQFEPANAVACVRGTHSIPPLNAQWCWGQQGVPLYGRAHAACATVAASASASASAAIVTTVAMTARTLERRCVRAWHTFHRPYPPQHTMVLGAARGMGATNTVCTAPAAVASSTSASAAAHAAKGCQCGIIFTLSP